MFNGLENFDNDLYNQVEEHFAQEDAWHAAHPIRSWWLNRVLLHPRVRELTYWWWRHRHPECYDDPFLPEFPD